MSETLPEFLCYYCSRMIGQFGGDGCPWCREDAKDKLKEAVGLLKRTQYVYNGYNGSPCHECLCQEGETHNPECQINNFIRDNQGE